MKLINVALDTELSRNAKTETDMGFAMLGSVIGSGIAEIVIDKNCWWTIILYVALEELSLKEKKRLYP